MKKFYEIRITAPAVQYWTYHIDAASEEEATKIAESIASGDTDPPDPVEYDYEEAFGAELEVEEVRELHTYEA